MKFCESALKTITLVLAQSTFDFFKHDQRPNVGRQSQLQFLCVSILNIPEDKIAVGSINSFYSKHTVETLTLLSLRSDGSAV